MTSGSVPPVDDQASTSTKEPTDGQPLGAFPITPEDLTDLLQRVYRSGWDLAKVFPERSEPIPGEFDVAVDHPNQKVDLTVRVLT